MRSAATPRSGAKVAIAAAFACFACFILFAAARMPMSYDDAMNAAAPLNLLRGNGYASHYPELHRFDPSITSGSAYIAPAALAMRVLGTGLQSPMLYAAAVSLALYAFLLRSLYRHAPEAALAAALLVPFTLWQGKSDWIVPGDVLPAPPFGFWYQLLGNLPGVMALALAMSLLIESKAPTVRRWVAVAALSAFAANAKIMHLIPLAAIVIWVASPWADPGRESVGRRVAIAASLAAAGACGFALDGLLARMTLDGEALRSVIAGNRHLMMTQSGADVLLATPLMSMPRLFVKSIDLNARAAVSFFGGPLQSGAMVVAFAAAAIAGWRERGRSSVARLALVLGAGAAAHFAYWIGAPSAPTRHLTPAAELACFAVACGFGAWWTRPAPFSRARRIRLAAALAALCALEVPRVLGGLRAWDALRDYRAELSRASAALERLADEYPGADFCGANWWVPRDLVYLAPRGLEYCNLSSMPSDAPGRRILMLSTNLWPIAIESVRAADARCTTALETVGRFQFRGCDGFRS